MYSCTHMHASRILTQHTTHTHTIVTDLDDQVYNLCVNSNARCIRCCKLSRCDVSCVRYEWFQEYISTGFNIR
jgi:hypothetical protein